jgi:4-alpha-glucanotransferase
MGPTEARDAMIRMAAASVADLAVLTAQDVLCLGGGARMNKPSTPSGNWAWRMDGMDGLKARARELRETAMLFDRCDEPESQDDSHGID